MANKKAESAEKKVKAPEVKKTTKKIEKTAKTAKIKKPETTKKPEKKKPAATSRTPWLGDKTNPVLIDEYALELDAFLNAMADGKITKKEVRDQEKRVAALMAEIEPLLSDKLHEKITTMLISLSAFNVMQTIHTLHELKPAKSAFHG